MTTGAWVGAATRTLAVLLLASTVVAGCITGGPDGDGAGEGEDPGGVLDHAAIAAAIGTPVVMAEEDPEHDHTDPRQHTGSYNLELVTYSSLDVELGANGFANFVFHTTADEDLLFIAIDGDENAGFNIVDASDPRNLSVLGEYRIRGTSVQEVRVTPDGNWAVMNVQHLPNENDLLNMFPTDCPVCIHIVDIRDRSDPQLVGLHPVDVLGTHNFHFHELDGELHLFYVGQPLTPGNTLPGNYVSAARFVDLGETAALVDVGRYTHTETYGAEARSFPHDVIVEEHPGTGQHLAYLSHWDGGHVVVDWSNPAAPMLLDTETTREPSGALATHWFAPEPRLRADGRLIAWSAPEIGALDSDAGAIRAFDVTDPAAIEPVGAWMVPGDVWIPDAFIFSGHIVIPDMERGLLAVSHYHAGVWVLDMTQPEAPRHLAYYLPHTDPEDPYLGPVWWKKPNFDPEGFLPNVYQARWHDDLLWVSERGSGLYVLEYTGPVPGAV